EYPYVTLNALVHKEVLSVRADLYPIGGTHVRRFEVCLTLLVDPPDLSGAFLPVRVAGVEGTVRRDREVVRLVHLRLVTVDLDLLRLRIDLKHFMLDVV